MARPRSFSSSVPGSARRGLPGAVVQHDDPDLSGPAVESEDDSGQVPARRDGGGVGREFQATA